MESQRVLRRKNRAWIDPEPVKAAFDRLVDAAAAMSDCDGYFTRKKRSFVFKHRNTGKRPYSFIVTKDWLRFYFREPSIPGRARHEERLREIFRERFCTDPNDLDEWTVNVTSESEARFLVEEVLRPTFL